MSQNTIPDPVTDHDRQGPAQQSAALYPTGRPVDPPLIGAAGSVWHAIGWLWPPDPDTPADSADAAAVDGTRGLRGEALCGVWVAPQGSAEVFDPDRWPDGVACPACLWWYAIRTDTVGARVARLAAEPGRELAVAVAEAILADLRTVDPGDPAEPGEVDRWDVEDRVGLLAVVSEHAGMPLIAPECAEGCDHSRDTGGCPTIGLVCHACSLPDPYEDHRYRAELTVAVPCSVLATLAAAYGVLDDLDEFCLVRGGPRQGKNNPAWHGTATPSDPRPATGGGA